MRFQFLISLSLLSQTAVAFQTAPITFDRTTSISTALENNHNNSPHPGKQIVLLLPKNRKSSSSKQQNQKQTKRNNNNNNNNNRLFLSKLKLIELSALTQLKKDERNNFNKRQLLKLGITTTSALFVTLSKSSIARAAAATPLLVSKGGAAITPLIVSGGAASVKGAAAVAPALVSSSSAPGLGIAKLPGMCRISPYEVGRLPNEGAMFFALALFVATGLLRSAGGGYARLMHFMFKCTGLNVGDGDSKSKEDIELGLAQESDWGTYSHDRLDPLQQHKKNANMNAEKVKDYVLNPYTMLFERTKIKKSETEEAKKKLQQASKHFQDQKYKQHHHPVHVARTEYEQNSYLGSLAINDETKHDDIMPKGYLDTLSNAKSSTWDVYKHQLDGAKPVNEVDELKQDLTDLQTLLQEEQSMYQTSNQALKLAMEAQSEEHHHSTTKEELKDFDEKLSTNEELKAFDKKAREFEEITVVEVESKEKKVEEAAE